MEPGQAAGEVRAGAYDIALLYATPSWVTPEDAAHQAAILNSAITGRSYGPVPGAAQETSDLTRIEILRAETRTLALSHRAALAAAVQQTWPEGGDQADLLQRLDDQLVLLSVAVAQEPTAHQMRDQLYNTQLLAADWLDQIEYQPDTERVRRSMGYPLAAVIYDFNRLAHRLDATAEAVTAERAAAPERALTTQLRPAGEHSPGFALVPQAVNLLMNAGSPNPRSHRSRTDGHQASPPRSARTRLRTGRKPPLPPRRPRLSRIRPPP
ncbi:hypothetical protein [Streptomyces sp. SID1121]|uniref:hypothetical protein n=1 Tax=Streptomyces sp. SID1121 TaxID=3425888 RepID=UPI004057B081